MPLIAFAIVVLPVVLLVLTIDTVRSTRQHGVPDFQFTYRAYGA